VEGQRILSEEEHAMPKRDGRICEQQLYIENNYEIFIPSS
jgi:hypothetical protein